MYRGRVVTRLAVPFLLYSVLMYRGRVITRLAAPFVLYWILMYRGRVVTRLAVPFLLYWVLMYRGRVLTRLAVPFLLYRVLMYSGRVVTRLAVPFLLSYCANSRIEGNISILCQAYLLDTWSIPTSYTPYTVVMKKLDPDPIRDARSTPVNSEAIVAPVVVY